MCIRWKCLEREGKTVRTTTFSALLTPIYWSFMKVKKKTSPIDSHHRIVSIFRNKTSPSNHRKGGK
jgi:hypothetical protein